MLYTLGRFRIAAIVLTAAVLACSAAVVSSQIFSAQKTPTIPTSESIPTSSPSPSPATTSTTLASTPVTSFLPSLTPAPTATSPASTAHVEPTQSPTSPPSTSVVPWGSVTIADSPQSSDAKSNESSVTQTSPLYESTPLFDVQVTYAYVGPRTNYFSAPGLLPNQTLSGSLYPSLVCFNVTFISNSTVAACDGAIEVYRVQVTADTGVSESYTFTVGTNLTSNFNPQSLSMQRENIETLMGAPMVNGGSGYFTTNLTLGGSIPFIRAGSLGHYQSGSGGLGFWSNGPPSNVTVTVYRLGCILLTGFSGSNYYWNSQVPATQVQLAKYGDGFLFNVVVPQNQLPEDLFNPPI